MPLIHMRWERQLDQDAMNLRIRIESLEQFETSVVVAVGASCVPFSMLF
jgi:hypothetical protein